MDTPVSDYDPSWEAKEYTQQEYRDHLFNLSKKDNKHSLIVDHHSIKLTSNWQRIWQYVRGFFGFENKSDPVKVNYELLKLLRYGATHNYFHDEEIKQLLIQLKATISVDPKYREVAQIIDSIVPQLSERVLHANIAATLNNRIKQYHHNHPDELKHSLWTRLFTKQTAPLSTSFASIYYNQGLIALSENRLTTALESFSQALELSASPPIDWALTFAQTTLKQIASIDSPERLNLITILCNQSLSHLIPTHESSPEASSLIGQFYAYKSAVQVKNNNYEEAVGCITNSKQMIHSNEALHFFEKLIIDHPVLAPQREQMGFAYLLLGEQANESDSPPLLKKGLKALEHLSLTSLSFEWQKRVLSAHLTLAALHQENDPASAMASVHAAVDIFFAAAPTAQYAMNQKLRESLLSVKNALPLNDFSSHSFILDTLKKLEGRTPKDKASYHAEHAKLYYDTQNIDAAWKEISVAYELDPSKHLDLFQSIASTVLQHALQHDDYSKALPLAEKLHHLQPRNVERLRELVVINSALNHWDRAEYFSQEIIHTEPLTAPDLFLLAKIKQKLGKTEEAKHKILQAALLAPHDRDILSLLYELQGNLDGLTTETNIDGLLQILAHTPNDISAHQQLARLYLSLGDLEKAKAHFIRCSELNRNDSDSLVEIAKICEKQQQFLEAIDWYQRALPLKRKKDKILSAIAHLYERLENKEKALDFYQQAYHQEPSEKYRIGAFQMAIACANQQRQELHLERALEYDELSERFAKAHDEIDLCQRHLYDTRLKLTQNSLNTNKLSKASTLISKLLESHPYNLEVQLLTCQLYRQCNDQEKLREHALLAFALDPRDPTAVVTLYNTKQGFSLLTDSETIAALQILLQRDPNNLEALQQLAECYYKQNDLQKALDHYQQLIIFTPNKHDLYFKVGEIYERLNDPTNALRSYEQALNLFPHHQLYKNKIHQTAKALGAQKSQENQIEEAIRYYEIAADQHSDDDDSFEKLGWLYQKNSRLEEALLFYKKAHQIRKTDERSQAIIQILSTMAHQKETSDLRQALDLYQDAYNYTKTESSTRISIGSELYRLRNLLFQQAVRQQNIPEAEHYLHQLIKSSPNNIALLIEASQFYKNQAHTNLAQEYAHRAFVKAPDNEAVICNWFQMSKDLSSFTPAQALVALNRELAVNPTNPQIHLDLARYYLFINELDRALEHCRQAIQKAPHNALAHALAGDIYKKLQDNEQAFNNYFRAYELENDNEIFQLKAYQTALNTAEDFFQSNEPAQAFTRYQLAIVIDPRHTQEIVNKLKALSHSTRHHNLPLSIEILEYVQSLTQPLIQRSAADLENHNDDNADDVVFFETMSTDVLGVSEQQTGLQGDPKTDVDLGQLYFQQQNFEKALEHYQAALIHDHSEEVRELVVDTAMICANRATTQHRLEKAIELYRTAFNLSPERSPLRPQCQKYILELQLTIVKQLIHNQEYTKALSFVHSLLQSDEQSDELHLLASQIYKKQQDQEHALEHAKKAYLIDPNRANTVNWYHLQGNFDEFNMEPLQSIEALNIILEESSNRAPIHIEIAKNYRAINNFEQAKAHCLEALAIDPNNAQWHFFLGNIYEKMNDLDNASRAYSKTYSLRSNAPIYANKAYEAAVKAAELHRQHNRFNEALELYVDALEKHPSQKTELAKILLSLGKQADDLQRSETSKIYATLLPYLNLLSESDLSNSERSTIMCSAAQYFVDINRLDDASDAYQGALSITPHHADAFFGLGVLAEKQHNLEEALENFKRSIEVEHPNKLHCNRCYTLAITLGNYANAEMLFIRTSQALNEIKTVIQSDSKLQTDIKNSLGASFGSLSKDNRELNGAWSTIAKSPNLQKLNEASQTIYQLLNKAFDGKKPHLSSEEMPNEISQHLDELNLWNHELEELLPSLTNSDVSVNVSQEINHLLNQIIHNYSLARDAFPDQYDRYLNRLIKAASLLQQDEQAIELFNATRKQFPSESLWTPIESFSRYVKPLKFDDALRFIDQHIEENPSENAFKKIKSDIFFREGKKKLQQNSMTNAYQFYTTAVSCGVDAEADCYAELADLCYRTYKAKSKTSQTDGFDFFEKSARYSMKAADLAQDNEEYQFRAGRILHFLNDPCVGNPMVYLKQAAVLSPDNPRVWYALAREQTKIVDYNDRTSEEAQLRDSYVIRLKELGGEVGGEHPEFEKNPYDRWDDFL